MSADAQEDGSESEPLNNLANHLCVPANDTQPSSAVRMRLEADPVLGSRGVSLAVSNLGSPSHAEQRVSPKALQTANRWICAGICSIQTFHLALLRAAKAA
jgi:hypothetical protein